MLGYLKLQGTMTAVHQFVLLRFPVNDQIKRNMYSWFDQGDSVSIFLFAEKFLGYSEKYQSLI